MLESLDFWRGFSKCKWLVSRRDVTGIGPPGWLCFVNLLLSSLGPEEKKREEIPGFITSFNGGITCVRMLQSRYLIKTGIRGSADPGYLFCRAAWPWSF
ncbi:hypothetical protein CEXT_774611 [Caerostris extrusa]|uniref:Uncharacterized protein n=1 Tax=Caerostris extrusa TaxID=172846 RepID=A0AAV4VFQ8_CAEEX|nr:hypothetical protein CEXT_774611 [Caerostris extrusa]